MNTFNTRSEWLVFVRATLTEYTAREMSQHLGLTRSVYRYYETGDRKVPDRVVSLVLATFPKAPTPPGGRPKMEHTPQAVSPVFRLMVDTYPDDAIPKSVILRWLGAL